MGPLRRAWSSPSVLVGLRERQAQAYCPKGPEKYSPLTLSAAHEHLKQLESLLILNLFSRGDISGLGQNPPSYPQDMQRDSSLAHWVGDPKVGWEWTGYIPVVQTVGEPLEPQTVLYSGSSHGWTRRPYLPCGEQAQSPGSRSSLYPSLNRSCALSLT